MTQVTDADNINFLYAPEAEPTRFHAFATYTNTVLDIGSGHYCGTGPDFASLGLKAGQDVTLSFIYQVSLVPSDFVFTDVKSIQLTHHQLDGSKTYYYQCADITLVEASSFVRPQYTCGNYTETLQVASKEDSLQMSAIPADKTTGVNPHTTSVSGIAPLETGSSPSASAEAASSSSGLSAGAKGGIGAGVAVFALLLIGGAVYFFRNKSRKNKKLQQAHQVQRDDASDVDSVQRMKQVQA